MGALPRGESVGGEAGVDKAEVGAQRRVGEIEVVGPELARVELALVHHGGGGEGADVESVLSDLVRGSLQKQQYKLNMKETRLKNFV